MSKILFVEDGSVDVDELEKILPEVPIVVYRQGSLKPEFVEADTTVRCLNKNGAPEGYYDLNDIHDAVIRAYEKQGTVSLNPIDFTRFVALQDSSIEKFIEEIARQLQNSGVDSNAEDEKTLPL